MATGKQPFPAQTAAGVPDAILHRALIPVPQLNPELPPKLEEIINKALEKGRDARYQAARDMREDLRSVGAGLVTAQGVGSALAKGHSQRVPLLRWPLAAGILALVITATVFWLTRRWPPSAPGLLPDLKLRQLTANSFENRVTSGAISPDGKYLAYTDSKGMHLKPIESGEIETVPQPEAFNIKNLDWDI